MNDVFETPVPMTAKGVPDWQRFIPELIKRRNNIAINPAAYNFKTKGMNKLYRLLKKHLPDYQVNRSLIFLLVDTNMGSVGVQTLLEYAGLHIQQYKKERMA